jgi:hypothetical protein
VIKPFVRLSVVFVALVCTGAQPAQTRAQSTDPCPSGYHCKTQIKTKPVPTGKRVEGTTLLTPAEALLILPGVR